MSDRTRSWLRIILKGSLLFLFLNFAWPWANIDLGKVTLYNHVFPGRPRLSFGEHPDKAYNLNLYHLDAMFRAHELAQKKAEDEFRIVVLGDSSVWGILLRPEETLTGQINQAEIYLTEGKTVKAYNLGYPSMSVTKDLIILDEAMKFQPDLIIWLVTLESLPRDQQLEAPLAANNLELVCSLIDCSGIPQDPGVAESKLIWSQTWIGRRRELADLFRHQLYGVMWAATGIDQEYPLEYTPALRDFGTDPLFKAIPGPNLPADQMVYDVLDRGVSMAAEQGIPVMIVNEPVLVSQGVNSDIRYNYYYPRWAYDDYRDQMLALAMAREWLYYDLWDIIPEQEFTNSAVHLSPHGETMLALKIVDIIQENLPK